ncbi:MAG: hypothetical protein Q7T41_04085 [Candidatus Saccharibacteria bacterium]|nr:hypothetical protein [Candidatus Saccharibacteria bacterium]
MKKRVIKFIIIFIVVNCSFALLIDIFFGGAHPECAYNDSVGSCDFVPRVGEYLIFIVSMTVPFTIFMMMAFSDTKNKQHKNNKSKS